ncbi:MAG TPA: SEC-C metal-binding domain-containing protein, partial [Chthoniobacterales bacterium]
IAMLGLGRVREDDGDLAGAEDYFWRAVQAHPGMSRPYMELSRLLGGEPGTAELAEALGELAISRRVDDLERFIEDLDFEKAALDDKAVDEFKQLPPSAQARVIALTLRDRRKTEPEHVTERLRPLRLIQQLLESENLDRSTVDAIVAEGPSLAPLLVGVLRDWAQELLGEEEDTAAENALALLGELGSPAEIPFFLEFTGLQDTETAGAAAWALGRICERHPREAEQLIRSIAPRLGAAERLAVAEQILRHPELDPAGDLIECLSADLEAMKPKDRADFFPTLLGSMLASKGRRGLDLAREVLARQSSQLSRDTRRECDELLAAFLQHPISPARLEPSPYSVYDICEGEAVWSDDEEDEEAEDEYFPPPEPVRRAPTPGRNEPCWCGSGKKYKKCHLDSDTAARGSQAERERSAGSQGANEFDGLRRRIGEFLEQVLSRGDIQSAIQELFGDWEEDRDSETANMALVDWMVHDRVAPSLGRTVIEEFLARRGSRLAPREREMAEAWSKSFVGLYEVQEVAPGAGVEVKDLISGDRFFVHDVSMSRSLARWDGLLARVGPGERGTEFAGAGVTVPRHNIEPLREWMEANRADAGLEWPQYLKQNLASIRRRSFELSAKWMESILLANTDGEELLFSKAVYRLADETGVIGALQTCPEFHHETEAAGVSTSFVWLNGKETVMGNIRIAASELTLECNSRQRLERGQELLQELAGESLQHLRDEYTTQKELRPRASEGRRSQVPGAPEIGNEAANEAVARIIERHYQEWPNVKLPGLQGKTPRESVRTEKGRERVMEILKDIENGEDRKRQRGELAYDVGRLRAELGLER